MACSLEHQVTFSCANGIPPCEGNAPTPQPATPNTMAAAACWVYETNISCSSHSRKNRLRAILTYSVMLQGKILFSLMTDGVRHVGTECGSIMKWSKTVCVLSFRMLRQPDALQSRTVPSITTM